MADFEYRGSFPLFDTTVKVLVNSASHAFLYMPSWAEVSDPDKGSYATLPDGTKVHFSAHVYRWQNGAFGFSETYREAIEQPLNQISISLDASDSPPAECRKQILATLAPSLMAAFEAWAKANPAAFFQGNYHQKMEVVEAARRKVEAARQAYEHEVRMLGHAEEAARGARTLLGADFQESGTKTALAGNASVRPS